MPTILKAEKVWHKWLTVDRGGEKGGGDISSLPFQQIIIISALEHFFTLTLVSLSSSKGAPWLHYIPIWSLQSMPPQ